MPCQPTDDAGLGPGAETSGAWHEFGGGLAVGHVIAYEAGHDAQFPHWIGDIAFVACSPGNQVTFVEF